MSDTSYPVFQHYGTNAQRLAFTPNPAAGTQPLYTWYETDTGLEFQYTTTWVGPLTSGGAVPIDVTLSQTIQTNTSWVVPESLTIDAGVILEIAGGARVEITGPVGSKIAQVVATNSTEFNTGSTQIPADDTIPQNTEGDEYMTRTITPTNATSTLVIQVTLFGSTNTNARHITAALFRDSNPDALAVGIQFNASASTAVTLMFQHSLTAGSTSPTTFKVRAGMNASGTMTFNGVAGARFYGATTKSSIVITEVMA